MGLDDAITLWLAPQRRAAFESERAATIGATPIAARTYLSRTELRLDGDAGEQTFTALAALFEAAELTRVERSWRRITGRGSRSACSRAVSAVRGSPLASEIVAVFGLDDTAKAESYARKGAGEAATGVDPLEIARAYRLPLGLSGAGNSIGIVYLTGTFHARDLENALAVAQIPVPRVVGCGDIAPSQLQDDYEIALDTQVASFIAPGADIVLYRGENDAGGYADAIARALLDDEHAPSVISISYGVREAAWPPEALTVIDQLFVAAALCGVTIVAASGDHGSDVVETEPQVVFPASSAFVLACGGTNLRLERGRRLSEVVWNGGGIASGGGYSRRFERPAWQTPSAAATGRGIPDVAGHAASANGYRIYFGNEILPVGGTSAVAPLWAGFIALVNERLGRPCGFFTPLLYGAKAADLFYDVTSGNNGRYDARVGWDECTGFGSPHFGALLAFLAGAA